MFLNFRHNASTKSLSARAERLLVDALFPARCYGCGAPGIYLCKNCARTKTLPHSVCPHCSRRIPLGKLEKECKRALGLDILFTCSSYKDPAIARLIKDLKFKNAHYLSRPLSELAYEWMQVQGLLGYIRSKDAIVVPVPGHIKKVRKRGFNPAGKISASLSGLLDIPACEDNLIKTKNTKAQVETLSGQERENNVKNCFALKRREEFRGKTILLVDDVITTGSTMRECARVLRKGRPSKIIGLAIAKD